MFNFSSNYFGFPNGQHPLGWRRKRKDKTLEFQMRLTFRNGSAVRRVTGKVFCSMTSFCDQLERYPLFQFSDRIWWHYRWNWSQNLVILRLKPTFHIRRELSMSTTELMTMEHLSMKRHRMKMKLWTAYLETKHWLKSSFGINVPKIDKIRIHFMPKNIFR